MPTLNLTYSVANKCYVKSLGYWMNGENRVPRYFRFPHPNTPAGLKLAQAELIPLVAQWQTIRNEAKAIGRPPIWFNPTLAKPKDHLKKHLGKMETGKLIQAQDTLTTNAAADPDKLIEPRSIADVRTAFLDAYKPTVKPSTYKGTKETLASTLRNVDTTQPMRTFDALAVVDGLVARITPNDLRGKTVKTYSKVLKSFVEWYAKKSKGYYLPENWKEAFTGKRFKNAHTAETIFNEDGTEQDFLIYSTEDLKIIFDSCNSNRQKLYVLLALNAATYFVDIAHAIREKNIHLDAPKPFLLYRREKESHHESPIIQKVWLWEETAKLIKAEMQGGDGVAFLGEDGKPMSKRGPEETWKRLWNRLKKDGKLNHRQMRGKVCIRFTDLRKTGGTAIANFSSADLGDLHLGHKVDGIGSKYIKLSKKRLYKPVMKWREELKAAGVFENI